MNSALKLNALQSGPFTAQKNLVDVILPGGKQYDLTKSYLNLVCSMSQSDVSGTTATYNWEANWLDSDGNGLVNHFDNSALVKNCRMTSDRVGILEDRRRNDVLIQQLKTYSNNDDDFLGTRYKDLCQIAGQGNIKLAPNIEFFKEGSTKSRVSDMQIQIPLKDCFELANHSNLPCDKLGDTRLHFELNLDRFNVSVHQGAGTRASEWGKESYTEMGEDTTVGSVSTLTTTEVFEDLGQSPFWVNQRLDISGVIRDASAVDVSFNEQKLISSIEWLTTGADKGKIKLTMDSTFATIASGETMRDVVVDGTNATISLSVNEAELILEESGMMERQDELVYSTYLNEEDNGNSLTTFSRLYNCEENAFNLLVCLPDASSDLICVNGTNATQFQDYRIRVDNVDLTNRKVVAGANPSPLYYDRVGMYMLNANLPLRNLIEVEKETNKRWDTRYTNSPKKLFFMGTPLAQTPQRKLVQLSINGASGAGGVKTIQLYKQIVKQVKL